jgi:hypothetical protein
MTLHKNIFGMSISKLFGLTEKNVLDIKFMFYSSLQLLFKTFCALKNTWQLCAEMYFRLDAKC